MNPPEEPQRVLIVASAADQSLLADLFTTPSLVEWEVQDAETLDAARFVLEHEPPDALLVDEAVCPAGDLADLERLRERFGAGVVLLVRSGESYLAEALEHDALQWLPWELALAHPAVVSAALRQARRWSDRARSFRQTCAALQESRRQVSRLVGLLWETTPVDAQTRWFTQRHVLDRLQEEVARAERYQTLLTVVRGEFHSSFAGTILEGQSLASWAADRILRTKRRCDVVGRYGSHGFLLLLPHTSENGAASCCRRLKKILEHPPHMLTVHLGVASLSRETPSAGSLLRCAEKELERMRAGNFASE
jgi:diguanylate cyclase (GGDEF)-like protein